MSCDKNFLIFVEWQKVAHEIILNLQSNAFMVYRGIIAHFLVVQLNF